MVLCFVWDMEYDIILNIYLNKFCGFSWCPHRWLLEVMVLQYLVLFDIFNRQKNIVS